MSDCGFLNSLSASPGSIPPGHSTTVTAYLAFAAQENGCQLDLSYDPPDAVDAGAPTSLFVPGGSQQGQVSVTTNADAKPGTLLHITATSSQNSKSCGVMLLVDTGG